MSAPSASAQRRTVALVLGGMAISIAWWQASVRADECAYFVNRDTDTVTVMDPSTGRPVDTLAVGNALRPVAVAITPDGGRAFVANQSLDTVSVVHTATRTIVATIAVKLPFRIAVAPDGLTVWIGAYDGLTVVDAATYRVTATIPISANRIVFRSDSKIAYVLGSQRDGSALLVVDVETKEVSRQRSLGVQDIAISPDGLHLYTVEPVTFRVMDLTALDFVRRTEIGFGYPSDLVLSSDGTRAYVGDLSGGVWVVDTATQRVLAWVPLGRVDRLFMRSDGRVLYARAGPSIAEIDTATNTVTATIPQVGEMAVSPDGALLYVVNGEGVFFVDAASGRVLGRLLAVFPQRIAASQLHPRLFLAADSADSLLEVDASSGRVTSTVPLQPAPVRLVLSPDEKTVYVATAPYDQPGHLFAVDTASDVVRAVLPINAGGLAVSPDGVWLYVSNGRDRIDVVQTATHTGCISIDIPFAGDVAFNPRTAEPYVVTTGTNAKFVVIDTETYRAHTAIPLPLGALESVYASHGILLTPDGRTAYVALSVELDIHQPSTRGEPLQFDPRTHPFPILSPRIVAIDTATRRVTVALTPPGGTITDIGMSADGARLYVDQRSVASVIDTRTNTVVETWALEPAAVALALGVGPPGCVVSDSSSTPTPTATGATPTPTSVPTPVTIPAGDCNRDGAVEVADLLVMVSVSLGDIHVSACAAGDVDSDGEITVDEILTAVSAALSSGSGMVPAADRAARQAMSPLVTPNAARQRKAAS